MRLSDIMSNMNLSFYPQVALVIFLAVFVAVVVRVFSKSAAKDYEEASKLPLED